MSRGIEHLEMSARLQPVYMGNFLASGVEGVSCSKIRGRTQRTRQLHRIIEGRTESARWRAAEPLVWKRSAHGRRFGGGQPILSHAYLSPWPCGPLAQHMLGYRTEPGPPVPRALVCSMKHPLHLPPLWSTVKRRPPPKD